MSVMASLGGYDFVSNNNPFNEMSRSRRYDWAVFDRYQDTEQIQFKGKRADEITLDIKVSVDKRSDLDVIPSLQSLGDSGEPQTLIIVDNGSAQFHGKWAITSISSTNTRYVGNTPIEQTARLTIKEFAE